MESSFEKIYAAVRRIPKGYVSSYGRIAMLAGNPRWSRVVGYALNVCRDVTVPCHRVVRRDGSLSPVFCADGINFQAVLLAEEGVEVEGTRRVDMARFAWP